MMPKRRMEVFNHLFGTPILKPKLGHFLGVAAPDLSISLHGLAGMREEVLRL
jgi:hypothetical protein